ncbi:MAG: toxin-antitoxin system HicB family antitoxin [Bacteroidales bacterium]|nr:toxin-antitoxin system HicB family antitoxin [Bacteroidales bacterium]
MRTSIEPRVQTAFRLPESLIWRVKREASKEGISVNRFVERAIAQATELDWPVIPEDYELEDNLSETQCCLGMPSREEIEADSRMAHILGL